MDKQLTIYQLYPDLMDVYADHGNVAVLEKRCAWRGIEASVRALRRGETPDFEGVDIVLLGAGDLQGQKTVAGFGAQIAEPLKAYIENGGAMLAIGEGYQLLGRFFEADGERIDGFGILDMESYAHANRHVGHFAVEAELGGVKTTLVGFEQHASKTDIKNHKPLGNVLHGSGNENGFDGVVYKNLVGTYMHGPILPKNPELADFLIRAALERKYGESELSPLDDSVAQAARGIVLGRLK